MLDFGNGRISGVARDLENVMEKILTQRIDALVLCQTLTSAERWKAMTVGHELRPEMKILVMKDEFAQCPAGMTASILGTLTRPKDFIAAVQQITSHDSSIAAKT